MIKHNQDGAVNGAVISLILAILLLIGAMVFGGWAYSSRQDYKNHTDQKIADAVTVAKQVESTAKDKQFTEDEKNPLKTYTGPQAYGSLVIQFPKTWSGAVDDTGSASGALVDGYFNPGVVPSLTNQSSIFAMRVQVLGQTYAATVQSLDGLQQSQDNPTTFAPYALPKLPKVVGLHLTGGLPNQKTGTMVVLPLRSQTLEIWTEGGQFTADFNNYILPNFSFSP